jgi:hypothetical protein
LITGRKPAADYEDQAEVRLARTARALVCLIAAVLLVLGGILTLGGKLL